MAELTSSAASPRGRRSGARLSTRIDFTPMVDLGFLLITFFMLTTMLSQPVVMPVVMPEDDGLHKEPLKASKALTLLLGANDKVYWYEGLDENARDSTDYSDKGLRRVILDKMAKVNAQFGLEQYSDKKTGATKDGSQMYVMIKPMRDCVYKNVVDVLDEMAICRVRYYTIMD